VLGVRVEPRARDVGDRATVARRGVRGGFAATQTGGRGPCRARVRLGGGLALPRVTGCRRGLTISLTGRGGAIMAASREFWAGGLLLLCAATAAAQEASEPAEQRSRYVRMLSDLPADDARKMLGEIDQMLELVADYYGKKPVGT